MRMNKRHEGHEITNMCKWMASVGLVVGTALFLLSFIASAYNKDFFLTIVSLGIIGASMVMFGFGLFMGLLTETYHRGPRENV
ncbi:MFS transporter [Geobacillus stearothermophilus]|uniref:MFS transporter n=1 Tax=Geobacillus TaxID=129337 RepID=UPI000C282F51|nr:MFS transporter [Geobacillus sp. Manikaran-105]MED4923209.1 MFS transporter [Anoxybacillus geothermalis]QHN50831.1 MFS transporter [Geobacillus stearothermophilus]PJW14799.1 MFS transporter [Geobacillus sp. Manikaran-105]WJQ01901.1 MFS transporter [Geobacillus stearothermophilus]WJQ04224.1 MFS transporter [Geobacillus stearothermophilus]